MNVLLKQKIDAASSSVCLSIKVCHLIYFHNLLLYKRSRKQTIPDAKMNS